MYVWAQGNASKVGVARQRGVQVRESVELCTIYWHFLLLVWLVLCSALMLST